MTAVVVNIVAHRTEGLIAACAGVRSFSAVNTTVHLQISSLRKHLPAALKFTLVQQRSLRLTRQQPPCMCLHMDIKTLLLGVGLAALVASERLLLIVTELMRLQMRQIGEGPITAFIRTVEKASWLGRAQ